MAPGMWGVLCAGARSVLVCSDMVCSDAVCSDAVCSEVTFSGVTIVTMPSASSETGV